MRFHGNVGFGSQTETRPGVWDVAITERTYFGDVQRPARQLSEGSEINGTITVSNVISIVADGFAHENIFAMKYVVWNGQYWIISNAEVLRPRIQLRLGGVYNGPKAETP